MVGKLKAILLAAGTGTRLRPYTDDRPKCMVELGGTSLLERQISTLHGAGIRDIVVVGGYRAEQLSLNGAELVLNEAYDTTNMVTSLMCTRHLWSGPALVAYTDIVYQRSVLDAILGHDADYAVVVDLEWSAQFRDRFGDRYLKEAEELVINEAGRIESLGSPISTLNRVHGQYIGLLRFSEAGLHHAARLYDAALREYGGRPWMRGRSVQRAFMTDLLQALIDDGAALDAVPVRRGWLEVDQTTDLDLYQDRFATEGRLPYYDPAQ